MASESTSNECLGTEELRLLQSLMRRYCDTPSVYPDIEELRDVLTKLTDVQKIPIIQKNYTVWTPLTYAALSGHKEMISTLLTSVSQEERLKLLLIGEQTPLHEATFRGNTECVKVILDCLTVDQQIKLLVSKPVYLAKKKQNDAERVLSQYRLQAVEPQLREMIKSYCDESVYPDIVKLRDVLRLLTNEKEINLGQLLNYAATRGHTKIIQALLTSYKEDRVKLMMIGMQAPLHDVFRSGDTELLNTLLTSIPPDLRLNLLVTDMDEMTPLHEAALRSNTVSVKLILDCLTPYEQIKLMSTQFNGITAIQRAEQDGCTDLVRVLREYEQKAQQLIAKRQLERQLDDMMDMGYEPDIMELKSVLKLLTNEQKMDTLQGNTLDHTARRGHTDILHTLLTSVPQEERLKLLSVRPNGRSLLHVAAHSGNKECVERVILILDCLTPDQQIELMSTQCNGITAIQRAEQEGHSDIVRVLREYGQKAQPIVDASGKERRKLSYTAVEGAESLARLPHSQESTGEEIQQQQALTFVDASGKKRRKLSYTAVEGAESLARLSLSQELTEDEIQQQQAIRDLSVSHEITGGVTEDEIQQQQAIRDLSVSHEITGGVTEDEIQQQQQQAIRDLSVSHEITGGVTLIWMRSKSSQKSLFHIVAKTLDNPVYGATDDKTVSTHYITNRLLQIFIKKNSRQALSKLSCDKRQKMLKHNPAYIVTRSLPVYSRSGDSDSSSCDSDDDGDSDSNMPYSLSRDDFVDPEVSVSDDGREVYLYTNGNVSVSIQEPQSPSVTEYIEMCISSLSSNSHLRKETLKYQMHSKLKNVTEKIRRKHVTTKSVVTAVILISGAIGEPNEPTNHVCARVFLQSGVLTFTDEHILYLGGVNVTEAWLASVCSIHHASIEELHSLLKSVCQTMILTPGVLTPLTKNETLTVNFREEPGTLEVTVDSLDIELARCFWLSAWADDNLVLRDEERVSSTELVLDSDISALLGTLSPTSDTVENQDQDSVMICKVVMRTRKEKYRSEESREIRVRYRTEPRVGLENCLVLAKGDSNNVSLPSFSGYADPFTQLLIVSKKKCSTGLARFVSNNNQIEKREKKGRNIFEGLTPLVCLDEHHNLDRKAFKLLQFKFHGTLDSSLKSYANCHSDAVWNWFDTFKQHEQIPNGCLEKDGLLTKDLGANDSGARSKSTVKGRATVFDKFKTDFVTPRLPASYKYPTAQLKIPFVAPPSNIGSDSDKSVIVPQPHMMNAADYVDRFQHFLDVDDEAHMKCCEPSRDARSEVTNEQIEQAFDLPN